VIHCGKFERYLSFFGRRLAPFLQPGPWRKELLRSGSPSRQRELYEGRWDHPLWRGFFRIFFSRWLMGRAGRDPAFLAQAKGDIAGMALQRVRVGLCDTPARSNPYLQYVFTGNYGPHSLPLYLRPRSRALIRARLGRLKLAQGEIQEAGKGSFDAMVLSDIFEYMSRDEHRKVYARLLKRAKKGARLAYWNLFVPRQCPLPAGARPLRAEAARLHRKDKAWFYSSFELDQRL
jgi:S-adenosylmethionine-diacylglycerol 3-amino-3-carboxypropyl transferase